MERTSRRNTPTISAPTVDGGIPAVINWDLRYAKEKFCDCHGWPFFQCPNVPEEQKLIDAQKIQDRSMPARDIHYDIIGQIL